MNAIKFVVLLIFVGVVGTNVGARQLEEVSKETKFGISSPKTVTTNGIGAELDLVTSFTRADNYETSNAAATAGSNGPSSDTTSTVSKSTYGSATAQGPNASTDSYSNAYGGTSSGAAAGPNGAGSGGTAYGGASSGASGTTGGTTET
ncbi:hypothetical protein N665_1450s0004 [Sinapis alba]|nr:hypothetical protein N665_1450s0004 [Sinapis alba]